MSTALWKRIPILMSAGLPLFIGCSQQPIAPPPAAPVGRYAALDRLPDFSGNWEALRRMGPPPSAPSPSAGDVAAPVASGPSLTEAASAEMRRRQVLAAQGKVYARSGACLPAGGAGFWMGPHPKEIIMSPEKILVWNGTADGVSYRRIAIDGRAHDTDADPTYLGESIGHFEGDTLVVDVTNFLDDVPATSMGDVFVPNGGGLHVIERWHLTDPETLRIDMVVDGPKVLTKPWELTLNFKRLHGKQYEMTEAVCAQNTFDSADAQGFQHFNTTPPPDLLRPPAKAK